MDLDGRISDCDFFMHQMNSKSKDCLDIIYETCDILLQNEWIQSQDSDYLDILYDMASYAYNIDKPRFKKIFATVKILLIKYT